MKPSHKNIGFYAVILLLLNVKAFAQTEGVSIKSNAGAPHTSAMLEIESLTKGLLIPRVSLVAPTNGTSPISGPADGLLAFNTNTLFTSGRGFHYWDQPSSVWTKLGESLWTRIGSTSNIQYYNPVSNRVVIGNSVSTPSYNLEVLATNTDTYSCKFDAAKGQQMRFGYYDLNGAAGYGPGSWLTIKSGTNTSTSSESIRMAHLMSNDELVFAITSYGKPYGTIGQVNIEAPNGSMFLTATGSLTAFAGDVNAFSKLGITGWVTTSDSTLKTGITTHSNVLSKVALCRPVTYKLKTQPNSEVQHGFLAQEIALIFPELVSDISIPNSSSEKGVGPRVTSYTTKKGISYTAMIPILLKAIQEQQVIIDDLKNRIQVLERK